MRLRNVKGSREAIAESEFTINDFAEYKEDIRAYLDKQQNVRKGRMMFI